MTSRYLLSVVLAATLAVPTLARAQAPRAFGTPEDAVAALQAAAKARDVDPLVALFGSDGRDLAAVR